MSEKANLRKKFFLSASVLIFSATQVLLFTLLPVLAEALQIPLSEIILCFSLGTLLFLWGSPYWSSKSDTLGRKTVINIGLTGLALSFATIVFLYEYSNKLSSSLVLVLLIISRVIYGLVASAIVPVAQLARRDLANQASHLSTMLSHSLALSLGRTIGPALLLLAQNHFETLLICLTVAPLLVIFSGPNEHSVTPLNSKIGQSNWIQTVSLIKLPLTVTVLFTGYVGLLHSSLGHSLELVFSLTGSEASQLMAQVLFLGSIVMAISQILARLALRSNFKLTLFIGLTLLSVGAIVLAFMDQERELWLAISFISAGVALIQPGHLALVHTLFPTEKLGKEIGILSSGNTIGYAFGGGLAALLLGVNIYKFALLMILVLLIAVVMNTLRIRT